jgi:secondary thiamine-phosphate synthase enzyme
MEIFQKEITLEQKPRGFNLITHEILSKIPEIKNFSSGTVNIFLQHTSASLTINENADPTVRQDMETHFNKVVPESGTGYLHTFEGPDDMTSHIKSSMLGVSLTIPLTNGKLNLGTWQGIYLCEHRNRGGRRRIVITITGEKN